MQAYNQDNLISHGKALKIEENIESFPLASSRQKVEGWYASVYFDTACFVMCPVHMGT